MDTALELVSSLFNMSDKNNKGFYVTFEGLKSLAIIAILVYQFGINSSVSGVPESIKILNEHSAELIRLRESIDSIKDILRRNKIAAGPDQKDISTAVYN